MLCPDMGVQKKKKEDYVVWFFMLKEKDLLTGISASDLVVKKQKKKSFIREICFSDLQ